jgi:hypothetical protein
MMRFFDHYSSGAGSAVPGAGFALRYGASLLAPAALVLLAGCTCGRDDPGRAKQSQQQRAPSSRAAKEHPPVKREGPPRRRRHYAKDKKIMRRINMYARDMRRRLKRDGDARAPAKVVAGLARKLPTTYRNARFLKLRSRLIERAEELGRGTAGIPTYNGMLQSCISCHQTHSPGNVRRVERLQLSRPAPNTAPAAGASRGTRGTP